MKDRFEVSERRACQVLRQPRATQRYLPKVRDDEHPLTRRIIELASIFGRYGYRQVTALLRLDGWWVNHKRVERIWRREGLKFRKNSQNAAGSGSTTVRVSDCELNAGTTCGPTTSCTAGRTKVAASGC